MTSSGCNKSLVIQQSDTNFPCSCSHVDAISIQSVNSRSVVLAGLRGTEGKKGADGASGGDAIMSGTAGETLSALRAVYEQDGQLWLLDYRDAGHIDQLAGITLTAAQAGSGITVQRAGLIEDSSAAWPVGRLYLGLAGQLTPTPPTDGFDLLLGTAVATGRLILNLQDPIALE